MATVHQLSENDHAMIQLLRQSGAMTVCELIDVMNVTATAVRQRLNRLMALDMVERTRFSEGRGRPSHKYQLTNDGKNSGENNLGDLAVVLWQEVQQIKDETTRTAVVSGVVRRLTEMYETDVAGKTTEERMQSFVQLFAERQIPVSFEQENGLPVIKVSGCPYPDLASADRNVCDMEKQLLAKLIGHPVELGQCQKDGDHCCSFHTADQKL